MNKFNKGWLKKGQLIIFSVTLTVMAMTKPKKNLVENQLYTGKLKKTPIIHN